MSGFDINGWGKTIVAVSGAAAVLGGPAVLMFNDLRSAVSGLSLQLAELEKKQVQNRSFQNIVGVQQWCDAVIREQGNELTSRQLYYTSRCPNVEPPVKQYTPPTPPWVQSNMGN